MFVELLSALDRWCVDERVRRRDDGTLGPKACVISLVGQTALLEAAVPLNLAATQDLDVVGSYELSVEMRFAELARDFGKTIDPHAREIWMPKETRFTVVFEGALVTGRVAEPDFVLLSKALKAPEKNRNLITEYLASGASPEFMAMARRYKVDLEQFL